MRANATRRRRGRERIHISIYHFLASDHELPPLWSPLLHDADGRERSDLSLDDLGDLEITREMVGYLYVDISAYTKRPYIYRVNLDYTPARGKLLCDYLLANCRPDATYELWAIDLGAELWEEIHAELEHLHREKTTVEQLTPDILARLFEARAFPWRLTIG